MVSTLKYTVVFTCRHAGLPLRELLSKRRLRFHEPLIGSFWKASPSHQSFPVTFHPCLLNTNFVPGLSCIQVKCQLPREAFPDRLSKSLSHSHPHISSHAHVIYSQHRPHTHHTHILPHPHIPPHMHIHMYPQCHTLPSYVALFSSRHLLPQMSDILMFLWIVYLTHSTWAPRGHCCVPRTWSAWHGEALGKYLLKLRKSRLSSPSL